MRAFCVAFALFVWTTPAWGAGADDARAHALFEESAEHYRAGRFTRAIELLREAYRLSGDPILLFNLAKAHEGNGDLTAAVAAYERYMREAHDVPDRGAITARIETLRAQLAARAELEKRAEDERRRAERASAAARRRPSASPLPWIVAGVGGAGVTAGIVLGVLAKSREADVKAEPIQAEAIALRDDAKSLALGANIAFAVGGALLAGGLAWGTIELVAGSRRTPKAALRISATRAELCFLTR